MLVAIINPFEPIFYYIISLHKVQTYSTQKHLVPEAGNLNSLLYWNAPSFLNMHDRFQPEASRKPWNSKTF